MKKGFSYCVKRKKKSLFIFIFYILSLFIFYPNLFLNFANEVPFGNHCDVKNILSIINHTIHSSITFDEIYSLPFLYPQSHVLIGTHPLLGVSVFFKVFKILGLNLMQMNNLYILLSLMLGAYGCFLLAKEFISNKVIAFLISTFYMIAPMTTLHFHWLNFLSGFYLPYIILMFIKFFKTKRKQFMAFAVILMILQFISSIYYGVHLWGFLIPFVILLAFSIKLCTFNEIKYIAVVLFIGVVITAFLIHPFLIYNNLSKKNAFNNKNLVKPLSLFSFGKVSSSFFGSKKYARIDIRKISPSYFPGFIFCSFFLMFFTRFVKKRRELVLLLLFSTIILACFLTLSLKYVFAEYLILFFLIAILVLFFKNIREYTKTEILLFSMVVFFIVLFFRFTLVPVLKSFSLYKIAYAFLPLGGMSTFLRVFPYIIPIIIVIAGIGLDSYYNIYKRYFKKKQLISLLTVLIAFMIYENYPERMLTKNSMSRLEEKDHTQIYKQIPYKQNKIILEIPFYFGMKKAENSNYMFNWKCHKNYLLNGKVTNIAKSYIFDLYHILGPRQLQFPKENTLKELIQRYSVTHIIFHWDLIKKYARKMPEAVNIIKNKIKGIKDYGSVLYENENSTILKVLENIPVKEIKRTYSSNHLRKNKIKIKLKKKYKGRIMIFVNKYFTKKRNVNTREIMLDFKNTDIKYRLLGNEISVKFENPVLIKDVVLL